MNKMVVVVFDSENKAYEGFKAFKEMHAEGSITLYGMSVIAKDAGGKVIVKEASDIGPLGTAVGLVTGSLIGLLGGPAGFVIGAGAGTIGGILYDLTTVGVGEDFLTEAGGQLKPGKTAVVAEVDEEWVAPLDTRMETLGGVVLRRARSEFIDAQIEREAAANRAEIAKLKAERDKAVGEAKAKLQAKIDAAQSRLKARQDQISKKVEAIKREGEAKIKSMEEQAAKAKSETKAKLEKRLAEARADHKARVDKLSKAWQLIKEAAEI